MLSSGLRGLAFSDAESAAARGLRCLFEPLNLLKWPKSAYIINEITMNIAENL